MTVIAFVIGVLIGAAAGYYAHYRWGAALAGDLARIKGKL